MFFISLVYVSIDTYTCLQYRREENSTREQRKDETPKELMKRRVSESLIRCSVNTACLF